MEVWTVKFPYTKVTAAYKDFLLTNSHVTAKRFLIFHNNHLFRLTIEVFCIKYQQFSLAAIMWKDYQLYLTILYSGSLLNSGGKILVLKDALKTQMKGIK